MIAKSWWMVVSLLFAIGTLAVVGLTQTPDEATLRQQAETAFTKKNWKQAYDAYRQLVANRDTSANKVPDDLQRAIDCMRRLNLNEDLDGLLKEAVEIHPDNWRVMAKAAFSILHSPHYGMVADQQFHRSPSRDRSGSWINTAEQDRHQALIWYQKALIAALKSVDAGKSQPSDISPFYLEMMNAVLHNRQQRLAWRLQQKTNLDEAPNFLDFEAPSESANRFAPVDTAGKPIYFSVPKSWEEATNDGERLRWLLEQTVEANATISGNAKLIWADFLNSQFAVDTLQEDRWLFAPTDDSNSEKAENVNSIYQIHTLSDDETIARLASGIQRFEIDAPYNPIKLYREIANLKESPVQVVGYQRLVSIYENRRQYSRAVEVLKQLLEVQGNNTWAKSQLANIVDPRGAFDPLPTQLAGEGAKLSFVFRNAKAAAFTAHQVDVEKLLADTKAFFQRATNQEKPVFGGVQGRYPPNILSPNELFQEVKPEKYLQGQAASWNLKLEPRENHWDRRIDVASPLQKAGLYLVTVGLDGGKHTARTLVWVQDTAMQRKPLSEKLLYVVSDSKTGQPIAGANVEFFGFGMIHDPNGGRGNWKVKNFAKRTDAQGQIILSNDEVDDNLQWLTIARTNDKRLAMFGVEGLWRSLYQPSNYFEMKAYGVSDRPIYRPGDKVHAKFWLATASYDPSVPSAPLPNSQLNVSMIDPQGKPFWSGTATTDSFGGAELEIPLDKQCSLGAYSFMVVGPQGHCNTELRVRVEEYRKPEFEVKIEAPQDPIQLGEKFKAKIEAKYYFGTPVAGAKATVRVERTSYNDDYYPAMPYDWCYGPGYWWFCDDYSWYPGWNRWVGCRKPSPWWFPRFSSEAPELVLEQEMELDGDGKGEIEIDSALAKAVLSKFDHRYNITVEVRDASRRTIVSSGEVIAARQAFKIYTWLQRGYFRVGDKITANFTARTLGGKPVAGKGKLSLLRVQYDAERTPEETLVEQWDVTTNDEGNLQFDLEAKRGGQYRLKLELTDNAEHTIEGAYLFTIRGTEERGSDFRFSGLELIPDQQQYKPGDKLKLQINADRDDALVMLFVRPVNGVYPIPKWIQLQSKSKVVEIEVEKGDQPNFFIEAVTVYDGEVHQAVREIVVPPEQRILNVQLKSDKTEYLPGEEAEVEVAITDPTGEPVAGSAVLAVYDRALDALAGDVLPRDIREFFWKWRRSHSPFELNNLSIVTFPIYLERILPFGPIGIFGDSLADDSDNLDRRSKNKDNRVLRGRGVMRGFGGGPGGLPAPAMAMDAMMAPAGEAGGGGGMMAKGGMSFGAAEMAPGQPGPGPAVAPKIRQDFADSAFWLGSVTADESGKAKLRFKMPENLTSWNIKSWAVGSDVRVGSATTAAITRKNLLVRLQMPRFLVERDEVVISSLVNNDLNDAKDVKVKLEIDGETQLQLIDAASAEQTVRVEAHGQVRVDWRCRAIAEGEATVRTLALTDIESDAMQLKIPVLVNGILKTESFAGTVRGENGTNGVKLTIPADRRPEQSRLTVRVSPSLAASMIDALPYMVDYPYGCTEQTLNRFLPTVITQRTLQQMQLDLAAIGQKRNNLNAQELGDPAARAAQWKRFDRNPVFSEDEVNKLVQQGVNKLTDMQNGDGGWGWFSGQGEQSWPHTTAVVVRGLLIARDNDVPIVPDVIERGLNWLDQYQSSELQKLKNAATETSPYKTNSDNLDALIFHILTMSGRINGEMQTFLFEKRENLSLYSKALLAIATHQAGNKEQTDLLRENMEQFLVQDAENETAYLRDNSPWWYWYGSEIESMAMYLKLLTRIDPQSEIAPRIVKYLLNQRKNATYWTSTRDTSLVVEAFADYLRATGELSPDVTAEVWMDDKRLGTVTFTKDNLFDVNNTIEIVGNAVTTGEHRLEIRRTNGKGSIYWNAYLTQFTLEEEIGAAGLEVKVDRRFYRQDRVKKDLTLAGDRGEVLEAERTGLTRISLEDLQELPSGTLVEVELLIESKNDYEYLLLEDRKPAGLEAVDTQSGYFSSGGLSAYRELRDQKTAFFLRALPRGKHSIRYQLRAEAPGLFTALPADISGMYAPELKGNSNDFDLKIVE
jgi:alpha-2-macroglobulin